MLKDILECFGYTVKEIDSVIGQVEQYDDYIEICRKPRRNIGTELKRIRNVETECAQKAYDKFKTTSSVSRFLDDISKAYTAWRSDDGVKLTKKDSARLNLQFTDKTHDAIFCIFCLSVFERTFPVQVPPKPSAPEPPVSTKALEVRVRITANGYKPGTATLKLPLKLRGGD